MSELCKTVFHDRHVAAGAKMVEFGGWDMPLQYPGGIVEEHLRTRRDCGLFDVSHMGRFTVRGVGALEFLQHVLTNNAAGLDVGQAQYTIIPDTRGGAIDDAYLYRFLGDEYLLVVNASNRLKDWEHFQSLLSGFEAVELVDRTEELAMLSVQGPRSREILADVMGAEHLPEPKRNELCVASAKGVKVMVGRTGYTGEPIGFELFADAADAPGLWDMLIAGGSGPVGLGARDTLRLEAGLPLYGHELGPDPDGAPIPIFACPLAKIAVSFSAAKGDFVGRVMLARQYEAFQKITFGDYALKADLPRVVMPVALVGKAIACAGAKIFSDAGGQKHVGYVTSGTMIPYWKTEGEGLGSKLTDAKGMRAVCLGLVDSDLREDEAVFVEVRGKTAEAVIVPWHMRSEAPPFARPLVHQVASPAESPPAKPAAGKVQALIDKTIANTNWRQRECINLIPSEQTASPMVRLLSIMDPAFRYAEHKSVKAFADAEVFYYQGVDFIGQVEDLLEAEMCRFLGCSETETRAVSGQMANAIVFSAMVDYLNRARRKYEPRRIRKVMNNGILKGGHLSSQPMGALRDFVAHDPQTDRPAVVNFPVLADNPYKIDIAACRELIARHRPELIILGRSVVLHREPVADLRSFVDSQGIECVIMYDMAHVLGLVGPHFQEPFADGADLVTGSTHKTFFGTQRGVVAGKFDQHAPKYELWEAVQRRAFPGAVSNHHLGTMLGLLMAAYEMNHFKDDYQRAVLANAKALAKVLKDCGMDVAGDPDVSYTETHQVVVNVGYAKGPELASKLEENNIIVNYQAGPSEEGFSAAGALRLGVAEMTRFGMGPSEFEQIAQMICDVTVKGQAVAEKVKALRSGFADMEFCFSGEQYQEAMGKLHSSI